MRHRIFLKPSSVNNVSILFFSFEIYWLTVMCTWIDVFDCRVTWLLNKNFSAFKKQITTLSVVVFGMIGMTRNYNFLINRALKNHFVHVVYHAISKDLRWIQRCIVSKEGK